MTLTTANAASGTVFVLRSSYEERETAKGAGFRWNPDRKVWWTDKPETAARLIAVADEAAKALLLTVAESQKTAALESRAVSADLEVPCPAGLAYLPFQRAGIAYALGRTNTLIADEMGLGKTVQAAGIINADASIQRVLVVCPASLKLNWQRELDRWLVRPMGAHVVRDGLGDSAITIINYDLLKKHKDALMTMDFDLIVLDEAHYIKNQKAQRTKLVKEIAGRAKRKLLLTGSPLPNRPSELFSLISLCDPSRWSNFFGYAKRYCGAYQDRFGWHFDGATHLDELQRTLRETIMVRRLKADVLTDLPAKRRQIIEMSANGCSSLVKREQEAEARTALERERLSEIRDRADALDNREAYEQATAALQDLGRVAFAELSKLRHDTAVAKAPKVVEHIAELLESVGQVIVFAHHHDVVAALMSGLAEFAPVKLTGECSQDQRQQAVDAFQAGRAKVFVGSITAAGVGITLTAASTVVFAELDWVPGNMSQAEDRAHRIGQTESVLVQHLVLEGSIDARMAKTLVKKQDAIDRTLDIQTPEVELTPGDPIERVSVIAQAIDPAEMAILLSQLRFLAARCDHASSKDGAGFNGADAEFGHALAGRDSLSAKQASCAAKMLKKYAKQLSGMTKIALA